MLRRFNKLLVAILLIALALYVVMMNREEITVRVSQDSAFTGNTGVILIGVFSLGLLVSALVALLFGLKSYLYERRLLNKEKQRKQFLEDMGRARSFLASGEFGKAQSLWEQMVRRDPTSVIARVELSRSLEGLGELREALKIVEAARATEPNNIEVLFRAADLNLALGNNTAAVDNLALILFHQPNRKAARRARDLSEKLGRFEDALEYHKQLESMGGVEESDEEAVVRIRCQQLVRDYGQDKISLRDDLLALSKRNPNHAMVLQTLGETERALGRTEDAAQHLLSAARVSGSLPLWRDAAKLWLTAGQPEKAISAAKSAAHGSTGLSKVLAELYLIRILIGLHRLEDAREHLDGFEAFTKRENVTPPDEVHESFLKLRGYCLNRLGKHEREFEVWRELTEREFPLDGTVSEKPVVSRDGPSPTLAAEVAK